MAMSIKFQILLAVLFSHAATALKAPSGYRTPEGRIIRDANIQIPQREPINPNQGFIDLGRIGLKSYYAQLEQMMNWTEAKDWCQNHFMRQATVDNVEQFDFLVDALLPYEEQSLWIGARESRHGQTMNIWDRGDKINDTVVPAWGHQFEWEPYHYCGTLWANGHDYSQFWTDHCDNYIFNFVLCQI